MLTTAAIALLLAQCYSGQETAPASATDETTSNSGLGGDLGLTEPDDGRSIDDILKTPAPSGNRTNGRAHYVNVVKVELDILYTTEQWARRVNRNASTRFRRNAWANTWLWPNALVPYELPTTWTSKEKRLFEAALKPYRVHTCLHFVELTGASSDEDCIVIDDQDDCSSFVGRQGGPQLLSLSNQCKRLSVIIHELGHAVGLFHEHNRPDRDDYIAINWENLHDDAISTADFQKNSNTEVDVMDTSYDYLSIMHYGEKAFSRNNKITIVAKNSTYQSQIGMSKSLGFMDIKRINLMYKCAEKSKCRKKSCPNNGFVGKDCRCWCPSRANSKEPIELCGQCLDYDIYCDRFKTRGFCTRQLFRSFMVEICPRACGICYLNSTAQQ